MGFLIINLLGGLCNRMFQIAVSYVLSKKYNKELLINILIENDHSRIDYFQNIFRKINNKKQILCNNVTIYREKKDEPLTYNKIEDAPNLLLTGFFQNEKYFADEKEEIYNLFEIEPERLNRLINLFSDLDISYFIHIRRGDYVKISLHNINLELYYQKAIEYILSINKDAIFYVFSDDVNYVKNVQWLNNSRFKLISSDIDEVDSLYLMSMCKKGGIAANSSFSWWGGYLNKSDEKIVIYPSKWFNSDWEVEIGWINSYILNIEDFTINKKIN